MSDLHHPPFDEQYVLDLRQSPPTIFPSHLQLGDTSPHGEKIDFTNYYMTYNGHPCIPIMGEFHFSRFPNQYWRHELQKMQAGGIDIVATYILWIHVEEEEGSFDWSGDRNVRAFLEACQSLGLQVLLRIGPFAHGECRNGGLPDWLYGRGIPVRCNDERYLFYVRRYFVEIAKQVTGLLFKDGGPVIGIQIENEYMHAGAPWEATLRPGMEWLPAGSEGVAHMRRLKQLAQEVGLQVPIYSCTAWGGACVPPDDFLPMHSGYAFWPWVPDPDYQQPPTSEFLFRDRHRQPVLDGEITYDPSQYPYAGCELGGGIQITYQHRPVVPPECVQALALVALGSGANLLGYYMYHGGSNPVGKHTYMNEFTVPRISYDFQAPIREYGQLNQSYHRLRALHLFLQDFGEILAPMTVVLPAHGEQITPEDADTLRYAARSKDGSGFLFLNNYQDHVMMHDHKDVFLRLELPQESLTLPHTQGLTLRKGVSAILPFNLSLDGGISFKYATAQVLTTLRAPDQTSYIFFAPDGMHAEFALDTATYQFIEVTGGVVQEEHGRGYVVVEPGLQNRIRITTAEGTGIQLFVLTQEQAYACWKVQLWGQERLILADALVLCDDEALHLLWRDQESISVTIYPALEDGLTLTGGRVRAVPDGFFTRYILTVSREKKELDIRRLGSNIAHIDLPADILDGLNDVFLSIDYIGDLGDAYLDGQLVSDNFANGMPWEIGLKRFVAQGRAQELILHVIPLRQDSSVLRYFPPDMAIRPLSNGTLQAEIRTITISPEYHVVLTQGI